MAFMVRLPFVAAAFSYLILLTLQAAAFGVQVLRLLE
jgi:hypothetical protein